MTARWLSTTTGTGWMPWEGPLTVKRVRCCHEECCIVSATVACKTGWCTLATYLGSGHFVGCRLQIHRAYGGVAVPGASAPLSPMTAPLAGAFTAPAVKMRMVGGNLLQRVMVPLGSVGRGGGEKVWAPKQNVALTGTHPQRVVPAGHAQDRQGGETRR